MGQRYARMAETHWQEFLPDQYAALTDPEDFFRQMGETAAEMVETLSESLATSALAGPVSPDETFHQTASRLSQAQHAAEATVVREFLLPAPPTEEPETGEDDLTAAFAEVQRLMEQYETERDEATTPE